MIDKANPLLLLIFVLTAFMLISAGFAVGLRFKRRKRPSRIAFLFFLLFLIADCTSMAMLVQNTVNKIPHRKEELSQQEIDSIEKKLENAQRIIDSVRASAAGTQEVREKKQR